NPKKREVVKIPDNEEIIFGLVTDKEADQSNISMYIREFVPEPGTENAEQLRKEYIENLFNRMISQRISELLQKGDPPFVNGIIARTSLTRNYDVTLIRAIAKSNQEELALSTILEEVERAKRFGFTGGELARAKLHFINRLENRVKEKDKISNDQYARDYRAHYLENVAFLDIEVELQLMQALFSSITTEDINRRLPEWFSSRNNVMVISGPESGDVNHLSEEEALAVMDAARIKDVDPYDEDEVVTSLISELPEAGEIVSGKMIPELGAEEWTLSNGAKVVYRHADYEKDNIGFKAYSPGGSSLYSNEYIPSTDMLGRLVPYYGIGAYDQATLQKILTGKTVELNVQLSDISEGLSGSASPKDFETLMQLIYLRFTAPRFNEEAHQAITGRYLALVENMNKNPQKIISDSLTMILSDYHPRTRVMDSDLIREVELEKIEEVYKERYGDASDFTFFFVGNISKDELVPMVEKYIATLPSAGKKETWIDHDIDEPEGVVRKTIQLSLSVPKSTSVIVLNKEMDYTPENLVIMQMIKGILDLRYTESIREEEGGTYGVMANASLAHFPDEKASLLIVFETDPEKVDHLKGLVYEELEKLVKEGPLQKDLSKTVENMLKDREENREHNSYWMNTMEGYYLHGFNSDDPANYEEIIRAMTIKDVKKKMKKLYKKANVVDLVFSPAEMEQAE
ncbi:MAG: insulinase family protein, partial [Bacteroidales bacterium]